MANIWLIGAGTIAQEYAKILNSLAIEYTVIGRGEKSAYTFKEKTGHDVIIGGLDAFLNSNPKKPQKAIIATPLCELSKNTISLLKYGVSNIFCEKPGFQYPEELDEVYQLAISRDSHIYYAYNRRFFSSVFAAENIIQEDGGIKSFTFEFTEWSHVIEKLKKPVGDLTNWMYANSSHVIDFLGGMPDSMSCYTHGSLSWHKPAVFAGAGITNTGALFSYQANWASPGRWGIEILTSKHRLYLRPMEKLQIQELGSISITDVQIDDSLDKMFKPGFYLQVKSFLNNDSQRLCSIIQQKQHIDNIFNRIIGG